MDKGNSVDPPMMAECLFQIRAIQQRLDGDLQSRFPEHQDALDLAAAHLQQVIEILNLTGPSQH